MQYDENKIPLVSVGPSGLGGYCQTEIFSYEIEGTGNWFERVLESVMAWWVHR